MVPYGGKYMAGENGISRKKCVTEGINVMKVRNKGT